MDAKYNIYGKENTKRVLRKQWAGVEGGAAAAVVWPAHRAGCLFPGWKTDADTRCPDLSGISGGPWRWAGAKIYSLFCPVYTHTVCLSCPLLVFIFTTFYVYAMYANVILCYFVQSLLYRVSQ